MKFSRDIMHMLLFTHAAFSINGNPIECSCEHETPQPCRMTHPAFGFRALDKSTTSTTTALNSTITSPPGRLPLPIRETKRNLISWFLSMHAIFRRANLIRPFSFPIISFGAPRLRLRAMTASTESGVAAAPQAKRNGGKTEVKILMVHGSYRPIWPIKAHSLPAMLLTPLSERSQNSPSVRRGAFENVKLTNIIGYTQSGALFRAKTRAVEKLLVKTLAPASIAPVLIYPTGPNRLLPKDIPGYTPPANAGDDDDYQPDTWSWWRKDEATGTYRNLEKGMATIAEAIRDVGGVDGICGFSQGGSVTSIVTAALEPDRPVPAGPEGEWVRALREANGGRPVKFAVSYSGFYGTPDALRFCYEPKIKTPTLHVIGSLDTVVDENRSQALVDSCENPLVVIHPGGHHVPVSKEWVMPLAGFIKQNVENAVPRPGL